MSSLSPPDPDRARGDRLESWKEIADYLRRQVRTVQRWEKSEGLPIHRHRHEQRGTVYAFRSELDSWQKTRTEQANESTPDLGRVPRVHAEAEIAATSTPRERLTLRGRVWGAIAILVVVGAIVAVSFRGGEETNGPGRLRMVVLPFSNLGATDEDLLVEGVLEELITRSARLAPNRLSVIGRTSAMRFAQAGSDLGALCEELQVQRIVEGSLRRSGTELQVTARLLHGKGMDQLWAETFEIQDEGERVLSREIAQRITHALERVVLERSPLEEARFITRPEAYDALQRGLYLWHKGTREGYENSVAYFQEAIAIDPHLLEAHVGLANAWAYIGRFGVRPPKDSFPLAEQAARRALSLDEQSAEAHAVLGMVHYYYDWEFEKASERFRRALELAPGSAIIHHTYGHFLSAMGLHEQALVEVRAAQRLEPLWPLIISDGAWFYYRARLFEECLLESRKALELEPKFRAAMACVLACLFHMGRDEEAFKEQRRFLELLGELETGPGWDDQDPRGSLAAIREWRYEELKRVAEKEYVSPHSLVFTACQAGNVEDVVSELERALDLRGRVALLTKVHPAFDPFRSDPRFQEIMEQVGFPESPERLLD